jgi:L-iditol 2-dehydrogenase
VELGHQVYSDVQVGDRVVASMLIRCGYCESCRRGLDNICDNARKPFQDADVPGPAGLAEYVLLEDYQLYKANAVTSFEELALAEPLACVARSVRKSRIERADTAVVVGAGIMGVLHLVLLKQIGARVIVSEPDEARADFASKMGADVVINPAKESLIEKVKGVTGGRGADVIYCAVSIASVIEQAVEAVAKGGRVHLFSSVHPRAAKISISPNPFHSNEIILTGTLSQDRKDVLQAVRMISYGLIDLKPFMSLVLPFERLEEALQRARQPDTYRVLVTM